MGLDITAYSRLRRVGHHVYEPSDPWCGNEDHVRAYAYDTFPRSFAGIPMLDAMHGSDGTEFLYGGCYAITPETETHEFRAGSYGGYGNWRRDLARQFNPSGTEDGGPFGGRIPLEPDPEKPFYELIWFADNEGTIGPEAAANLLADFRAHASDYQPDGPRSMDFNYMVSKYNDWTRACELATVGGLISFH